MSAHPLDDARLKVTAAMDNFDLLQGKMADFVEANPYPLSVTLDVESGEHVIEIPEPPVLPREWSVFVGQIGTNARSALDYLVHELVVEGGGRPDTRTQFPISESKEGYWLPKSKGGVSYRDRCLRGVEEQLRTHIDAVQPYHQGQRAYRDPLAILAKLTNRDKHRTAIPAYAEIETAGAIFRAVGRDLPSGQEIRVGPEPSHFSFLAKVESTRGNPGLQVQPKTQVEPRLNQHPDVHIAFAVENDWVSAANLKRMVEVVRGIITWRVFEQAFSD